MQDFKIGGHEERVMAGREGQANVKTLPTQRQDGRPKKRRVGGGGLVLDNFLWQIEFARKYFKLPSSHFEVKVVASFPKVTSAIERLIAETMNYHHGRVSAEPCSLLAELGMKIYEEPINTGAYSRPRISSASVELVLRRTFELGLQTIVELPTRDPKPEYNRKEVLSLAAALTKLGRKVSRAFREPELLERIQFILREDPGNLRRLTQVGEEIQWAGSSLQAIAERKLVRLRLGSPNPQTEFALSLARWIEACTGRPHYALLKTLTHAVFHAAGKPTPKWVERLEIEMNSRMNRGRKWIRTITIRS